MTNSTDRRRPSGRRRIRCASLALIVLAAVVATLPGAAAAEQASQPTSPVAGQMATGNYHSCALHASAVRCWGYGGNGQLGYGKLTSIGDDETPASAGSVDLDPGPDSGSAKAISAGNVHSCALLDDGTVRCWGFGGNGRLGYGNTATIGDDEPPASVGPVDLDPGLGVGTAKAISAGDGHTCAILGDGMLSGEGTVRCWGYGFDGRLGYNSTESIGDDENETPASAGPVDFGEDASGQKLTAKAITAGNAHTCALLSDNTVRCWGFGGSGRLGYGTARCVPPEPGTSRQCPVDVGRGCMTVNNVCNPEPNAPSPANMGPVDLGAGRTAKAISAGQFHTCAILDNDAVRCWGFGGSGRLGYGNDASIGDNEGETPGTVGPVKLGDGRTARAITAGGDHTCALLDDANTRCWGYGAFGQLGYANTRAIGDNETPDAAGPVDLGSGRTGRAVTAGLYHTCARLDNDSVRCWGQGANGRLGYCNENHVGDNETPGSVGPVDLPGSPGQKCPSPPDPYEAALAAQRARAQAYRTCLGQNPTPRRRAKCGRRYGRTPGRVTDLSARATGPRRIQLSWRAVGTDGSNPPAARKYLVKQSQEPIETAGAFSRAPSLCKGRCSYNVTRIGAQLTLTITNLRPRTRYYYAIAARDNVTGRVGPRSKTVTARLR